MLWTPSSKFLARQDNWGTNPTSTPGTSVTPGASNAEGSWTQIFTALGVAQYGIYLRVANGATAASDKSHLMDIGVDPAGGASYTAVISNIVCGSSGTGVGQQFFFPIFIPDGATVAVRIQGSNATAGTVRVSARVFGYPSAPWLLPVGQFSETIGTITNSGGVSFTPGNAADGTWVSLGTTARDLWWWQLGYQISNGTQTAERTYIDLGVGNSTDKRVIVRLMHAGTTSEECQSQFTENLLWHACYYPVKAGNELWVRGRCENAPDSGYNAVAIGIGG